MIPLSLLLFSFLAPLLALGLIMCAVLVLVLHRRLRRMTEQALHDPLTALPNRRGLELAWQRDTGPKALFLIDLVGFKAVNDTHGHVVGDGLLRQVAARLAATLAPDGMLARWGGDEFAAILPEDRLAVQKLLLQNAQALPYPLPGPDGAPLDVRIGVRIGEAVGHPELVDAIRIADRALLIAKID